MSGPDLKQANWIGKILEPVLAEVHSFDVHPLSRLAGKQDLTAISGRYDSCAAMNFATDVAFFRDERRPGVQPHAHADPAGRQKVSGFDCGGDRVLRLGERTKERIALRIDFHAGMSADRTSNRGAVLGEHFGIARVAELGEQLRRSLHVREQEGHRALRELASRHRQSMTAAAKELRGARRTLAPTAAYRQEPWAALAPRQCKGRPRTPILAIAVERNAGH